MRKPGAETLPGRAGGADMDRVVRQARMAVEARDFARQHRADGAIDVAHFRFDAYRRAAIKRRTCFLYEAAIERLIEPMILTAAVINRGGIACLGLMEEPRKIEPFGFPVVDDLLTIEHLHLPDHLVERAIPERSHDLAHFLGDEEEEIDHVLRLADEALAQNRVL